jgi:phosphosulfolactate synthase
MRQPSMYLWGKKGFDPWRVRQSKPRTTGLTCVLDKGLGLTSFYDLLELASDFIDFIKLGFGTAGITPLPILREKIALANKYNINIFPGGTFFEAALVQGEIQTYFRTLADLQIKWVEISDGTIDLPLARRGEMIRMARHFGFHVITEIGKKEPGSVISISQLVQLYEHDLKQGASYVVIEGRETGENIGIYSPEGQVNTLYVEQVNRRIRPTHLIWEAPQTHQQVELLRIIGSAANLGNIPPDDILSLEALRRGLRSDTFFLWK